MSKRRLRLQRCCFRKDSDWGLLRPNWAEYAWSTHRESAGEPTSHDQADSPICRSWRHPQATRSRHKRKLQFYVTGVLEPLVFLQNQPITFLVEATERSGRFGPGFLLRFAPLIR